MCNLKVENFDNPSSSYQLRDTCLLKQLLDEENYAGVKAGFLSLQGNILLDLEYLDEHGMLMALPPESLHVILLGLVPRLIQGLSQARKFDKSSKSSQENEDKGKQYVFSGKLKQQIKAELIEIGTKLSRQSDPDMPKTKNLSDYLIDLEKLDNASTGKKQAHEMRGVLLMVFF